MSEYRVNYPEEKNQAIDFYVFEVSLIGTTTFCPICSLFNLKDDNIYDFCCNEHNKYRYGFLYLKKCNVSGIHFHFTCKYCKARCIFYKVKRIEYPYRKLISLPTKKIDLK